MTTRRLAAILAADVVGFSSMMERDEAGTLRLLKATQRDLIEPRVREHHGRIVKTTGDGFLIEFGSPLEAVRCALEVQEAVSANAVPGGSEEALRLRMGINLGDIMLEADGDIYGDGVNVAARLEQIATAGSVCIARPSRPLVPQDGRQRQVPEREWGRDETPKLSSLRSLPAGQGTSRRR
jgi:adenylate cyclase